MEPGKLLITHVLRQSVRFTEADLDQKLTPSTSRIQGDAALSRMSGFTFLAWHDYTGDSRPGSNSVFIVEGTHWTKAEMLTMFREACPEIAARQDIIRIIEVRP